MLDILSNQKLSLCDQMSRRRALQIGGLGTMSLGLPQLLQSTASANNSGSDIAGFGKAKRVIMLFMWGGPAHQETWDLKPDGPTETRGDFLPIETNVPGIHVGEHFPLISQHADKLAIIRSVGQEDNNHSTGAHAGLTGRKHELKQESFNARQTDHPHYGSVLSQLQPNSSGMPTFVAVPEVIHTTNGAITPGQGGGFLGRKYDPFQITEHPDRSDFSIDSLKLPEGIGIGRLAGRRDLLTQIEGITRLTDRASNVRDLDAFYQKALGMVLSSKARAAFDLTQESEANRWRYGWHAFGQSVLMTKRLIEAGVKLVTVYWHRENKILDTSWDTHSRNFEELRLRLMPAVDRPIAALLEDLEASGLLDETLVIWNSEFGRTPRINGNGGRDHWGPCNSVVMAGGGVPGGQVFGATDSKAAYPTRDKVTQDDIAATVYHLLGLDPEAMIQDRLGRPFPLALGQPIAKLLGNESRPEPIPAPPKREKAARTSPLTKMLTERAKRYVELDFGNPDSERLWQLTGLSKIQHSPAGDFRTADQDGFHIKYTGPFFAHFDYGWLVLKLTKPMSLDNLQLTVGNRAIPIPEELLKAKPQSLWQISFPPKTVGSLRTLELKAVAPGFEITDLVFLGEEIEPWHLARLENA
ncbi:MAG: hypothetical protein CMJ78_23495 [Planctomycetaceae bacterium]|nr:hypothetical protein [Planctomycetaceae bacterium]